MGFVVDLERRYDIIYHGENIGIFKADLVVEDSVILEVKTGLVADPVAPAQTLNYLSASRLVVGLVAHFGPQVNIKRLIRRPEDPSGGMLSTL